jgi:hypothetical protein
LIGELQFVALPAVRVTREAGGTRNCGCGEANRNRVAVYPRLISRAGCSNATITNRQIVRAGGSSVRFA